MAAGLYGIQFFVEVWEMPNSECVRIVNKFFKFSMISIYILMTGIACISTGRDFPSDLNWIKKDQTSQKDVQLLLGDPESVGNSGGTVTWTYGFYKYQLPGDVRFRELKLFWDKNGRVSHFSYNSSFAEDIKKGTSY